VDLGPALLQKTGRPESAALRFTFGPVGDWYMLCTHDGYFRQALNARKEGAARFATSAAVAAVPQSQGAVPLANFVMDPDAAAEHLGVWLDHLDQARAAGGATITAQAQQVMAVAGAVQLALPHFRSIWGQMHAEADGVVTGQVELVRKP